MTVMRALSAVSLVLWAGTASAGTCPDRRASCMLHEEGVALFLEGKHDLAAAKFAAAIAAEPTARSYLGYAQAVESLGQIALAYDTMVAAQRLSSAEVTAAGGKDVDVNARQERIKYKLGELRAKIGFVWLRVPDGVAPQRVVAVQRKGEGDLSQPLTQWTAVAPNKQVLIASIDDGTKVEVVAQVAAGSQGVVVIPLAARVAPGPARQPDGGQVFVPMPPQPVVPMPQTFIALGASLLAPGPSSDNADIPTASTGTGVTALYERRLVSSLGLATRLEFLFHSETNGDEFNPSPRSVSATEIIALAGLRTWGSPRLHGRAAVGFSVYSQQTKDQTGFVDESFTRLYPTLELGGGLNLGRLRIQMGILFSTGQGDAETSLGTRFMGTVGFDLYRK